MNVHLKAFNKPLIILLCGGGKGSQQTELDDPNNRAAGLLALRDVAEANGG